MKNSIYLLTIMVLTPFILLAQSMVNGIVKNSSGPLLGVSVQEKGGGATQTDQNG